jgi:hypothetical protein
MPSSLLPYMLNLFLRPKILVVNSATVMLFDRTFWLALSYSNVLITASCPVSTPKSDAINYQERVLISYRMIFAWLKKMVPVNQEKLSSQDLKWFTYPSHLCKLFLITPQHLQISNSKRSTHSSRSWVAQISA